MRLLLSTQAQQMPLRLCVCFSAASGCVVLGAAQVSKLISEGKLKPTIAKVFPLAEAAAAHELMETGHVQGKVVLQVADLK